MTIVPPTVLSSPPLSPLLDGIDISKEQQKLPGAALLPVREEQVVASDAQGTSARRVERLLEHNILHVGRLDVLRKLHQLPTSLSHKPCAVELLLLA